MKKISYKGNANSWLCRGPGNQEFTPNLTLILAEEWLSTMWRTEPFCFFKGRNRDVDGVPETPQAVWQRVKASNSSCNISQNEAAPH